MVASMKFGIVFLKKVVFTAVWWSMPTEIMGSFGEVSLSRSFASLEDDTERDT